MQLSLCVTVQFMVIPSTVKPFTELRTATVLPQKVEEKFCGGGWEGKGNRPDILKATEGQARVLADWLL